MEDKNWLQLSQLIKIFSEANIYHLKKTVFSRDFHSLKMEELTFGNTYFLRFLKIVSPENLLSHSGGVVVG